MSFDFDYGALQATAHRPWPVPKGPWVMTQTWADLLFAHWPVSPQALEARVPRAFPIDTFDGQAWIGVVPFLMRNVAPRLPGRALLARTFPELNVRTYVSRDGKPGVFFFSLDAGSLAAVAGARAGLRLPYYHARMTLRVDGRRVTYLSRRRTAPHARATLEARYEPIGDPRAPQPGTLEHFLTERYCLYAIDHFGRPYRLEIHHPPWLLQAATADIAVNSMADAAGLSLPDSGPLLHFSKRQDMVAWLPQSV